MKATTPILSVTLLVLVAGTVASQLDFFGSKSGKAQEASAPILETPEPEPVVIRQRPQAERPIAERPAREPGEQREGRRSRRGDREEMTEEEREARREEARQEMLSRFDTDDEANVAIIHGNGRAFSSGADVHQRQLRSREEFLKLGGPQGRGSNSGDLFIRSVNWKPIITAPHGYVLGLAFGIILESDLIVAEEGTRIQLTETSRGLGGSKYWRLMQYRGGSTFSTEIALTGRFFTAEEGHAAGIIDRVAPKGKHLETAMELAQQVNANPPLSVRATLRRLGTLNW